MERLFSVEGANGLIPVLRQAFAQISVETKELRMHVEALQSDGYQVLSEKALGDETDPAVQKRYQRCLSLNRSINERLEELLEMGVEVKGTDGLVDLRSRYRGRTVYLCWKVGEEAFTHWHDIEAGFAGRQPITDPESFKGSLLN